MDKTHLHNLLNNDIMDISPWKFVTSRRLAGVLDIHLQTAANWRIRAKGPPPAPAEWFKGRPIRYRIGHVLSWAYAEAGIQKEPWEIYGEWLRDHMNFEPWHDREAVLKRVLTLMRSDPRHRPSDLRKAGRVALEIV